MVSNREWLNIGEYKIEKTGEEIALGGNVGKTPTIDCHYCEGYNLYKINTKGEVIGQNGKPLKYRFKNNKMNPYVGLSGLTRDIEGNFKFKQKEVSVTKLIEEKFPDYIKGYSKAKYDRTNFKIVPIDGNRNDLSIQNLEYVDKKNYNLKGTIKGTITSLAPIIKDKNDLEIAKLLGISRSYANKLKTILKNKGKTKYPELNNLTIAHKTFPVYIAVLESKGEKNDLEIAKELRGDEITNDQRKREIKINQIYRVRRKLEKLKLINLHINKKEQSKEIAKILSQNNKLAKNKRKTHEQIAKIFGVKEERINYVSRNKQKSIK